MSNKNSVYSFFIIMSLLFWNPLTFHLIYRNSEIPFSYYQILHIAFWLILAAGVFLIFLITKSRLSQKVNNIVFSFAFLGILFGLIVTANTIMGFLTQNSQSAGTIASGGLIFPPNTTAKYSTVEFDFESRINSIGLRDNEISIDKGSNYRILCFGDSWTFGWGVDLGKSWPKQLETYLHGQGYGNIEVINCGQGGQYTTTYKKHMAKAVPILKPDLVLVGVLQGDDLAQLYENNYQLKNDKKSILKSDITIQRFKNLLKYFLKASFSNFSKLIQNDDTLNIDREWESSVKSLLRSFDRQQLLNYETLDDTVKTLFETGNLNSGMLNSYVNNPIRFLTINQPDNITTKFAISEMENDFKEMKYIADNNGFSLIFINLPVAVFTGHKVIRTPNHWIFNDFLYDNNNIDSIYHSIANIHNLDYIQLTEHFKALEDKGKYFFKYDGHPNEYGYREIAIYIGEQLLNINYFK